LFGTSNKIVFVQIRELGVPHAWEFTPVQHVDDRGVFLEWFKAAEFENATGRGFDLRQSNMSVSKRGVVRGIHFADVPAGQAKYVTCVAGSILDVIVDLRVGSPTFGRWDSVVLDDVERACVFISEGLGHLFMATSESATVSYLTTDRYRPGSEHGLNPLDEQLALGLPAAALLSAKDAAAPTLSEARASGILPLWQDCLDLYAATSTEGA
jgi:dTDP-4-dehydrorhamnose 3,5-epimerase